MSTNHDVISAFLDNEPFEPQELSEALADPSGRALLIDLVALRKLAQPDEPMSTITLSPRRLPAGVRLALAAAVLTLAVLGGYQLGERTGEQSLDPPAPTVTIKSSPAWQDVPQGGSR